MMQADKKRIHMLDEVRGLAIICMIFHHMFLDIGDVLGLKWGYTVFNKLCIVQPLFWAAFIIISGMCSRLSRNAVKRGVIVLACGGVITLVTAVIMPLMGFEKTEIYFGILHCLGVCMIITGLLMPVLKKIDYRVGAAVSFALFLFFYDIETGNICFGLISLPESWYQYAFLSPLGLQSPDFYSADYFPVIPWIFMFLTGYFAGKPAQDEKLPEAMYQKHSGFLSFVGRNSLWVYLAHQPVLYAILLIISIIFI